MKNHFKNLFFALVGAGLPALPVALKAQLTFETINGDAIAITGYTGSPITVVIPATTNGLPVTLIMNGAFDNVASLTSVTIPNSVTSIGDGAFAECTGLTNLTVGTGLTNIGVSTFFGCYNLASVSLPNAVTSIGGYAFFDCYNLVSITFPSSVTNIGDYAFEGCSSLTYAYFQGNAPPDDGTVFSSDYGDEGPMPVYHLAGTTGWGSTFGSAPVVLLNSPPYAYTTNNGTVTITGYTGAGGAVAVPATLNGWSVTGLGTNAFYNCPNLTSVTIPNSVTNVGLYAFFDCASLNKVSIGNSVAGIGTYAFTFCLSLTNISVDAANPDYSSLNGVFFDKAQATLIRFPEAIGGSYTVPNSVTTIGAYAFNFCRSLTNIIIPSSVTSIGDDTFYQCYSLISAYFQGNAPPDDGTVFYATDSGVTTVYYLAGTFGWRSTFGGVPAKEICPAITVSPATFPGGTTGLAYNQTNTASGGAAPYNFTVSSGGLPPGLSLLSGGVLAGTPTTSGGFNFTVTAMDADGCTGSSNYTLNIASPPLPFTWTTNSGAISITGYTGSGGPAVIPGTINGYPVTSIANFAFEHSALAGITIPGTVTSIGLLAFSSCSSLTNVTLGSGVISIQEEAFGSCSSLTSITLPNSVTSMGDYAFYNCTSLAAIGLSTNLAGIGNYVFNNDISLASITIPNSVTSIGNDAIGSCTSLTNVTLGNGVVSIEDYAFNNDSGLTGMTIPNSVTSIGNNTFLSCYNLAGVTLGSNVASIGNYAFDGDALTNITIPASVSSIGDEVFAQCLDLTAITVATNSVFFTSVNGVLFNHSQTVLIRCHSRGVSGNYVIPGSVTNIADTAFQQCSFLTGVTIPNGVTSIGVSAFSQCNNSGFTNVIIPATVTSIGSYAFLSCNYLAGVNCLGNAPSADATVFTPPNNNLTVYYLAGTTGWGSTFGGVPAVELFPSKPSLSLGFATSSSVTTKAAGNFIPASLPGNGGLPSPVSLVAADVNGDGYADLICGNVGNNSLTVFTNNGSGGFAVSGTYGVQGGPYSITAADVNGDGKIDLISANYGLMNNNSLTVLTNNGSGGFVTATILSSGLYYVRSVAAADVYGNGKMDLICSSSYYGNGADSIALFTNNGTGGFALAGLGGGYSYPSYGYYCVTPFTNADGRVDLAGVVAYESGTATTMTLFTNNGSGSGFPFVPAATLNVGSDPTYAVAADVNGDGKMDLICANYGANTLTVLTNNGSGGFATCGTYGVGTQPWAVTAADVNGDGKVDLISANSGTNTLSIYTNNGTGDFALLSTLTVGLYPYMAAAADFNHRGWMDLACTDEGSNTLSVLTNTPALVTNSVKSFAISWPAYASNYVLQTNASLARPSWTNYGGTVNSNAGIYNATIVPPPGNLFFRLIQP